jgi:hypothetical protein
MALHRHSIQPIVQQQLEAVLAADPLRQKGMLIQQEPAPGDAGSSTAGRAGTAYLKFQGDG